MKAFTCIEYVLLIGLCITNIRALTNGEKGVIIGKVASVTFKCIQDNPITFADMESFREKIHPEGDNVKCFSACVFKNLGMMDKMGMLSKEGALMNAEQIFQGKDKAQRMKNVEGIMTLCAEVNAETTSDGEKGCDRAKLAYNCFMDNAAKYGFDFQY